MLSATSGQRYEQTYKPPYQNNPRAEIQAQDAFWSPQRSRWDGSARVIYFNIFYINCIIILKEQKL